jgi:hypothetical protein
MDNEIQAISNVMRLEQVVVICRVMRVVERDQDLAEFGEGELLLFREMSTTSQEEYMERMRARCTTMFIRRLRDLLGNVHYSRALWERRRKCHSLMLGIVGEEGEGRILSGETFPLAKVLEAILHITIVQPTLRELARPFINLHLLLAPPVYNPRHPIAH